MTSRRIKLAPSILSADFSRLGEQVAEVTKAGADYIHVDVMDGHFVPNITIGAPVVASLRSWTDLPLDVHLMIKQPEAHISQFAEAGADIVLVDILATDETQKKIESFGKKAIGVHADLSSKDCVDSIVDKAKEKFGRIDILVNNAGIIRRSPITEFSEKRKYTYMRGA